ncbi:MAG: RNA polymerase sigma factor, partial [Burkholderiaceae bacterium]
QFPTVIAIPAASVARYKEVLVILRNGGAEAAKSAGGKQETPVASASPKPAAPSAPTNPNAATPRP